MVRIYKWVYGVQLIKLRKKGPVIYNYQGEAENNVD